MPTSRTFICILHYLTLHERRAQLLLTNSLSSVASDMLSEPTANALCSVRKDFVNYSCQRVQLGQ